MGINIFQNKNGGNEGMNLKLWGRLFIVLSSIAVILTIGCETGYLGIKPATVIGRVVDQESRVPIAGAQVVISSAEAPSSGGGLQQSINHATTLTDNQGYFIFENITPDNVFFQISAPSYRTIVIPSQLESPDGGETLDVEHISILSGKTTDLKDIGLLNIAPIMPDEINLKVDIKDALSNTRISTQPGDDPIYFEVTVNNETYGPYSADTWREEGQKITPATELKMTVSHYSSQGQLLYDPLEMPTMQGNKNLLVTAEMQPVTYALAVNFQEVPDYVEDAGVEMKITVEYLTPGMTSHLGFSYNPPPTIVKQGGDASTLAIVTRNNTCVLPTIPRPCNIRFELRGYREQILYIGEDTLPIGSDGTYRIDLAFDVDDKKSGYDQPTVYSEISNPAMGLGNKIGFLDNKLTRDVHLIVSNMGTSGTITDAYISLPKTGSTDLPIDSEGGTAKVIYRKVPTGYECAVSVVVSRGAGDSYGISEDGHYINVPNTDNFDTEFDRNHYLVPLAIGLSGKGND